MGRSVVVLPARRTENSRSSILLDSLTPIMADTPDDQPKEFHGWRLIGVIMIVIMGLAIVSALVDWVVLQ